MDTNSPPLKKSVVDILKKVTRNMRHKLKSKYFDGIPANEVRKDAPKEDAPEMSDEQWQALVHLWSDAKHKVHTSIHG